MLIFICQLGALHKTPQSLHYWTNGSVPVDTHDFRMLLLSVGDLTSGWNRERTMTKLKPPAVFEIDWQKRAASETERFSGCSDFEPGTTRIL